MLKRFKASIDAWKENEYTMDLKKVYAQDRRQLQRVYNSIQKGQLQKAREIANRLDTIVRDQVPTDIYDNLYSTHNIEISDEFVCRFWPREQHPHITTADKISGQH